MVDVVVKELVRGREIFYLYLWKRGGRDAVSLLQPWCFGCQAIAMYHAPKRSVAENCQYSSVVDTAVLYFTKKSIKLAGKKIKSKVNYR